jgi:hypothetical protein
MGTMLKIGLGVLAGELVYNNVIASHVPAGIVDQIARAATVTAFAIFLPRML